MHLSLGGAQGAAHVSVGLHVLGHFSVVLHLVKISKVTKESAVFGDEEKDFVQV